MSCRMLYGFGIGLFVITLDWFSTESAEAHQERAAQDTLVEVWYSAHKAIDVTGDGIVEDLRLKAFGAVVHDPPKRRYGLHNQVGQQI